MGSMGEEGSAKWLVTGGAGFLGVHLCRGLIERGQQITAFDRADFPDDERVDGVNVIKGDVRDAEQLAKSFKGIDYVVHAAAALALESPDEIRSINAEGTRVVLAAAARAGVRRVVYVGTTAVYGMPRFHPIAEDAPLDPMGDYGIAKAAAERYCVDAQGVETVRIRPKSFIGTGRLGIFQLLFEWIEAGKRIPVLGDGRNRFQLMEVRDLVEAIYLAALRGRDCEVYNIGAASFGTVNEDLGGLLSTPAAAAGFCIFPRARPRPYSGCCRRCISRRSTAGSTTRLIRTPSSVSRRRRPNWAGTSRFSNRDALIGTYDWYLREGRVMARQTGTSHRVAWKQGALRLVKALM